MLTSHSSFLICRKDTHVLLSVWYERILSLFWGGTLAIGSSSGYEEDRIEFGFGSRHPQ
jgi:hypothetical protein